MLKVKFYTEENKKYVAKKDCITYKGPYTEEETQILNEYWTRSNGQKVKYGNMSDNHLKYAYRKSLKKYLYLQEQNNNTTYGYLESNVNDKTYREDLDNSRQKDSSLEHVTGKITLLLKLALDARRIDYAI